ncbi:MAG: Phosphate transport system permease protein PstC, partial [uncultured Phycisphaerae bacterium]
EQARRNAPRPPPALSRTAPSDGRDAPLVLRFPPRRASPPCLECDAWGEPRLHRVRGRGARRHGNPVPRPEPAGLAAPGRGVPVRASLVPPPRGVRHAGDAVRHRGRRRRRRAARRPGRHRSGRLLGRVPAAPAAPAAQAHGRVARGHPLGRLRPARHPHPAELRVRRAAGAGAGPPERRLAADGGPAAVGHDPAHHHDARRRRASVRARRPAAGGARAGADARAGRPVRVPAAGPPRARRGRAAGDGPRAGRDDRGVPRRRPAGQPVARQPVLAGAADQRRADAGEQAGRRRDEHRVRRPGPLGGDGRAGVAAPADRDERHDLRRVARRREGRRPCL